MSRLNANTNNVKEHVGNGDADNKQKKLRQVAPIDGGSQRSQSKLLAAVSQAQPAKANKKSKPSSAKQLVKKKSGGSAKALARDDSKGNIATPEEESRGGEEDIKKVFRCFIKNLFVFVFSICKFSTVIVNCFKINNGFR